MGWEKHKPSGFASTWGCWGEAGPNGMLSLSWVPAPARSCRVDALGKAHLSVTITLGLYIKTAPQKNKPFLLANLSSLSLPILETKPD